MDLGFGQFGVLLPRRQAPHDLEVPSRREAQLGLKPAMWVFGLTGVHDEVWVSDYVSQFVAATDLKQALYRVHMGVAGDMLRLATGLVFWDKFRG